LPVKKKSKKKKNNKNNFYNFITIILLIIFLLVIVIFFSIVKNNINPKNPSNSIESISIDTEIENSFEKNKSYNSISKDTSDNREIYILSKPTNFKEYNKKSICIILDDYGYKDNAEFLINLPFSLSVSILPGLPFSKNGFDIFSKSSNITPMLHIPMEAINNKNGEKIEIKSTDNEDEIIRKLDIFFSEIPAKFANNHMGSKISIDEKIVKIILNYFYSKGVRFIDSHTVNNSLFVPIGRSIGFPVFENNLFLDYNDNLNLPEKEFKKALFILNKREYIIIIGHITKDQTIDFLKKLANSEYLRKYDFITVRELFNRY